jgi:hypothetical protein
VTDPPERRYADALAKARAEWAAADPAAAAVRAGCAPDGGGVLVPLLGVPHLVTHPGGEVWAGPDRQENAAVAVMLLHYLLGADGTPPAGTWSAYRELPDGLFYAAAFSRRADQRLARAFATSPDALESFARAARDLRGDALTLGDASFRFAALPRVDVAVLVWAGDDEEPGEARVLFDAHAGHYLPAEDLAELGGQLTNRLLAASGS